MQLGVGLGVTLVRSGSVGPIPSSGMIFRLRASDVVGVTAGNTIPAASLIEKSGSGATISLADTDRSPIYQVASGQPIIRMRNNLGQAHVRIDVASVPNLDLSNFTMFVVHQPSNLADQYMASFIGTQVRLIQTTAQSTLSLNNANNSPLAFGPALSTATRYVTMVRGTTAGASGLSDGADIWNNGVRMFRHRAASSNSQWGKDPNGTPIAGAATSFYLGTQASGAVGSNWWGDLFDILLYNRTLSDSEAVATQGILGALYGATITAPTDQLIIDGDSLSNGVASDGFVNSWRALLPSTCALAAYGIGGQTTPFLRTNGARIDGRFNGAYAHNILLYFGEPTNDLNSNAASAQVAHDNIAGYVADRRTAHSGIKVVVSDCIARDVTGLAADFETRRLACNALVAADKAGADTFASVASDTRFDAPADASDVTNYNVDKVHLLAGDATHGYTYVVTSLLKPAIDTLLAS